MNLFIKVNGYLAWSYVVICLLQVLLFSSDFLGFLDNIFFPFALLFVILESFSNKESGQLLIVFSSLFLWTFISQIYSEYENSWFSNLSFQLIFLKLVCILVVIKSAIESLQNPQSFRTIIDCLFVVLVAINLTIAFNPFGIGEYIQHSYSSSNYVDFIYYHEPGVFRLAGTQLNPNSNAIVWLCFALYYLQFLKNKWALFILAIGLLLLTQSRTNVIVLLVCLALYIYSNFSSKGNWKRILYFGISIIFCGLLFVLKSSYLKSLFTGEAFISHSFLVRIENYMYLANYSFFELIIGKGVINKPIETLGFSIDSEYLGVIFQFGIIGLVFWLVSLFTLLKLNQEKNQLMYLLLFLVIINSFTNFTLLNLQIGVVLAFFLAISLKLDRLTK